MQPQGQKLLGAFFTNDYNAEGLFLQTTIMQTIPFREFIKITSQKQEKTHQPG